MSRFKITNYRLTDCSVDDTSILSIDIAVRGGIQRETLATLKDLIEGENIDRHQTYIMGGRGNGKLNYFSDWARNAIATADIAATSRFEIKKVICHKPATVVFWADGTKTVVKCQDGDVYSPETGIAMCYMKKALGNKSNFNNTFKKHIPAQLESVDNGKKKITRSHSHLNSEAIYRLLRENKSTVAELAKSAGIDRSTMYHWLRGGGVRKRNISKLIKVLHVSEEVIIKEEK